MWTWTRAIIILLLATSAGGQRRHAVAPVQTVIPLGMSSIAGMTAGPDGAVWFTGPKVGFIADGQLQFIPVDPGTPHAGIVVTADERLCFGTTRVDGWTVVRCTTRDGATTEYEIRPGSRIGELALAPDGSIWFTETTDRIGRIAPDGRVSEIALPPSLDRPTNIAVDIRGIFFCTRRAVGLLTPDGTLREFRDDTLFTERRIYGQIDNHSFESMAVFPDGSLALSIPTHPRAEPKRGAIVRLENDGSFSELVEFGSYTNGYGLTAGDEAIWFTRVFFVHGSYSAQIVKLASDGSSEAFQLPYFKSPSSQTVQGLAYDGRGGVWVALKPLFGGEVAITRVGH